MEADDADLPESERSDELAARPAPGPLPWYRRGSTWLGIVVVTAVGALVVSNVAENRLLDVDVDPSSAEAQLWCEQLTTTGAAASVGGAAPGVEALGIQAEAIQRAAVAAPVLIAADAAEVAEAWRTAASQQVAEQRAELDEQLRRSSGAARRVEAYTRAACALP
jgi:hypothetical protein